MPAGNVVLIAFYDLDSFAVRTLHAVLARAGVPVTSIFFKQLNANNTMDEAREEEIEALLKELERLEPILVGLSVRSTYYQLAARVSDRIRERVKTFVMWGGVHVTISPENCLDHADAICIGEGEEATLELAAALAGGKPVEQIRNLWLRRNGETIKNEQRPLIADLDSLPFIDFLNEHKILIESETIGPPPAHGERLNYWTMTSRGCPYSCTYCCNNVLRDIYAGKGAYVRRRSVEHVMDELLKARRDFPELKFLSFEDDVFTFDVKWLRAFTPRYKNEIGIPFFCYCHPKAVSDEMISLLKEAGAVSMTMGIQSGSEPVRRRYFMRNDTNEEIVRAAGILGKFGIHCSYDVIMDNPLEGEDDRRATLDLLLRLPRPFELHTHSLTHFPATNLTQMLLERGMIKAEDIEDRKQMSYRRWTPSLDLRRDRENLFWDNLYYMASKRSFPERLIRWLSRRRLLKARPAPLTQVLRLTSNYVQTVQAGSRWDWLRVRVVGRLLVHWRRFNRRFMH